MISDDENDLAGAIGDTENLSNCVVSNQTSDKKPSNAKDTEQKMNRKTVEMYDLMLKTGTKVKAYSKQDEDKLKAKIKLKKLGLNSISELDQQIQKELLSGPDLQDELNPKRQRANSEDNDQRKSSSDN